MYLVKDDGTLSKKTNLLEDGHDGVGKHGPTAIKLIYVMCYI